MNGRSITGSRLRREALIRGLSNCPSANIERRAPSRCGRRRAVRSYPPSGRTRNRALSHRPLLGFPGTAPTTDIPRDRKSGTHSKTELSSGTDHIAPPKKQQMPAAPHIPSRNRPHSTAVKATDARCAPYTLPEPDLPHRSKKNGERTTLAVKRRTLFGSTRTPRGSRPDRSRKRRESATKDCADTSPARSSARWRPSEPVCPPCRSRRATGPSSGARATRRRPRR